MVVCSETYRKLIFRKNAHTHTHNTEGLIDKHHTDPEKERIREESRRPCHAVARPLKRRCLLTAMACPSLTEPFWRKCPKSDAENTHRDNGEKSFSLER